VIGARWGVAVGVVTAGVLAGAAAADARLSLSISSPRIEVAPIAFAASGVAAGPVSDGESTDFLTGAVIRPSATCPPGGADDFGSVPGAVITTFDAFPVGPFNVRTVVKPTGDSPEGLLAGGWRECVYLQDRASNAVTGFGQEDFTVRKAHVSIRMSSMPRHVRFVFDLQGRANATVTFVVRASSQVPLRTVTVGIDPPGKPRTCTADLHTARAGISSPYRIKLGRARTYRIRTRTVFPAGPAPYGRRVRVCAVLGVTDPHPDGQALEGLADPSWLIQR
jgi:hypothetical protein